MEVQEEVREYQAVTANWDLEAAQAEQLTEAAL